MSTPQDTTVIFSTIHGSRLYGLHHDLSDHDRFTVVTDGKTKHTKKGLDDHVVMGVQRFLGLVTSGAHQSVEALFSPYKTPGPAYSQWAPFLDAMRVAGPEVYDKYSRTITAYSFGDLKARRHAVRLSIGLEQLRCHAILNPALSPSQVLDVKDLASKYEGAALVTQALALAQSTTRNQSDAKDQS